MTKASGHAANRVWYTPQYKSFICDEPSYSVGRHAGYWLGRVLQMIPQIVVVAVAVAELELASELFSQYPRYLPLAVALDRHTHVSCCWYRLMMKLHSDLQRACREPPNHFPQSLPLCLRAYSDMENLQVKNDFPTYIGGTCPIGNPIEVQSLQIRSDTLAYVKTRYRGQHREIVGIKGADGIVNSEGGICFEP